MEVAIAGGHGKVARRLARLLVNRGDRVRALIRRPEHADEVRGDGSEPVLCDLEAATPDELAAALAGADAVVFAAGAGPGSGAERKFSMDRDGAIKLLEAARKSGIDRYLMVSSTGTERPPDGDDDLSAYLRAKAAADRALTESDRAWTIVRPVSLTDEPGDGEVELSAEAFADRGTVSRDDVAAVLAAALSEPAATGRLFYVRDGQTPIADALAALLA